MDLEVATRSGLQVGDLPLHVTGQDRRRGPGGSSQSLGGNVFRETVHVLREWIVGVGDGRPVTREVLICASTQQQTVRSVEPSRGNRDELFVHVRNQPAAAREPVSRVFVGRSGALADPIERYELHERQFHRLGSPSTRSASCRVTVPQPS